MVHFNLFVTNIARWLYFMGANLSQVVPAFRDQAFLLDACKSHLQGSF